MHVIIQRNHLVDTGCELLRSIDIRGVNLNLKYIYHSCFSADELARSGHQAGNPSRTALLEYPLIKTLVPGIDMALMSLDS